MGFRYTLVVICVIMITLVDFSASERLINITVEKYEKSQSYNTSMQMCLNKWKEMVQHNGRCCYAELPHADKFPNKVSGFNRGKVLLVHVGKTGGGTANRLLSSKKINFQQVHVHAVDHKMLNDFDVILIGLRNPVERLISAYYYTHPSVGKASRMGLSDIHKEFYKCSPNIEDFANNLYLSTRCGDLARGYPRDVENMHIFTGACAYLGGVLDDLVRIHKTIYIINTENFYDDLNHVSDQLNWNVTFDDSVKSLHVISFVKTKDGELVARKDAHGQVNTQPRFSAVTLMQISGYLSFTGENYIYNQLQYKFGRPSLIV